MKAFIAKKRSFLFQTGGGLVFFILTAINTPVCAQTVLFDFDNIAVYSPFPLSETVGGISAHFSGTGSSYSIQAANVLGFTPNGFSGNIVYPNSIYQADLLISFDQKIKDFSIMYSVQELACDTSATMQAKGYMKGNLVVTSYTIASVPGTWPVDTLKCSYPSGFDSVVVHFFSHPSRCQDWGPIFMADNMKVIALPTGMPSPETFINRLIVPNPVSKSSRITFTLSKPESINITAYDITGRLVKGLFNGSLPAGEHQINWDMNDGAFEKGGVYLLRINEMSFTRTYKLLVAK